VGPRNQCERVPGGGASPVVHGAGWDLGRVNKGYKMKRRSANISFPFFSKFYFSEFSELIIDTTFDRRERRNN
jgi:hypothetical protein